MLEIQTIPVEQIQPNPRNARTHSKKQIGQIANSILAFGFTNPILVDEGWNILVGHGRLAAAKQLGLQTVRVIVLPGLSQAKKRALALADNKIAEAAGWDRNRLAIELPELSELLQAEGLDITVTGFEAPEIDQLRVDFEPDGADPEDEVQTAWTSGPAVTERGALWRLDRHRLLCGDARNREDLDRLMGDQQAAAAFLDPPYNVRVADVVGRGRVTHREFAMASGEMSEAEYVGFLVDALGNAARVSRDGALHYVCCDWRHVKELIEAGRQVYGDMVNLAVWVKTNAGQGSLYRSQHELIGVFRAGKAPHVNNVASGRHGRNRTNVWKYAGVNTFAAGRLDELRSHPTVKPVAMVADPIKDCTRPGDAVLDTFCGSGTTLMAAERVGRRGHGMEIDPLYVDVAIRRWQAFTRKDAVLAESGRTFDELEAERGDPVEDREDSPDSPPDRASSKAGSITGASRRPAAKRASLGGVR